MHNPRISVGLPVYNGERFLKQALDSLLSQDYEDFELIISDNASTDGTAEICKAYAAKDLRIRYSRNTTNIGSARNYRRVFELARGEFFKWCSHDDLCLPGFLSTCLEVFESAPPSVVLVYPQCELINEFGEVLGASPEHLESREKSSYRRLARVIRRVSLAYPAWGLIRSESLRKTSLTGSLAYGDDLLLAELSLYGELREVPEVLSQQRSHQGNALAICSSQQSGNIASRPNKVNRRTRQALLAWVDPANANRRNWLPIHEERFLEYLKRIHHAPLPPLEKLLCYLTVPAVGYWRRFCTFGGYWKRRLLRRR